MFWCNPRLKGVQKTNVSISDGNSNKLVVAVICEAVIGQGMLCTMLRNIIQHKMKHNISSHQQPMLAETIPVRLTVIPYVKGKNKAFNIDQ